jgi:hypothetical protein
MHIFYLLTIDKSLVLLGLLICLPGVTPFRWTCCHFCKCLYALSLYRVNSGAQEGQQVPAPLVTFVVFQARWQVMNEERIGFMLMIDHFYLLTNSILQSIQIIMLTGTDSVHKDIYKNGNKFIWKALPCRRTPPTDLTFTFNIL